MEQIVFPIVEIIAKYAGPVGRWLCYSFRYRSNIQNMKKEEKQLRDDEKTLRLRVEAAENNCEKIYDNVTSWLTNVEAEETNVEDVLKDEVKTGCSFGACLDVKRRHRQSRRAQKIAQVICNLRTEMVRFGTAVSHRRPPQELIPTDPDYVMLASRRRSTEELLNALRDTENNVIGIWGMGGVGKTTLAEQIAIQAKEEKLFDEVVMAYVTPSPDTKGIQQEIAEKLGMKLDEESVTVRASRLRERIEPQDKKTLVILDDIWKKLDLVKEIGIPLEGCKLILISRNRDVLTAMGTKKDIELRVLGSQEAWSLFEKMGGNYVKNPNILETATKVAEKCGGLPVALVTVSRALKNKDLPRWNDALRQLTRPVPGHVPEMLREVYMPIELSYEHLESDEFKDVFSYCALMAYDIRFWHLLKYCHGLRLFRGTITLEDATNRLRTVIDALEDSCLLQRFNPSYPDCFCMHDIVRDVGRHIASKNHNMLVMSHEGGWPDIDVFQRCKALSVLSRDIRELPECSKLTFFHVNNKAFRSLQMGGDFFEGLKNLRVLDLKRLRLSPLPPSMHVLTNLQTLCLDDCVLGDISLIGKLKSLQVLSLHSSIITQLPREIGLLTSLQLLDLSDCRSLQVIPPHVLSSLVKLEELYMRNSFVQWEADGLDTNERKNASLVELKCILSHLTTLEIHIPDSSILPKDLTFENLKRYKILVGDVWYWDWSDEQESWRTLKLDLKTSFKAEVGIKMQMQLKESERLFIDKLKGITRFVEELDIEGFRHLKHLHIQNNVEIKRIISSTMLAIAFPVLEKIVLKNLITLEGICQGQLPTTSFGNLRVVKVEHCEKLKFVFSSSVARGLSQLEKLKIKECSNMFAIVVQEGEGEIEEGDRDTIILFPRLRKLLIDGLPNLISFLSSSDYEEIISDVNQLEFHMPVLDEQVVFPKLEELQLSSITFEEMTTSSCRLTNIQPASSRFQNLSYLSVKGTCNVKYLFSLSTATSMGQLKSLEVSQCKDVEEILLGKITSPTELFPLLESLKLKGLPVLKRFCIGHNIRFLSLKSLIIKHCQKLTSFVFNPDSSGTTAGEKVNANERPHKVVQPLFSEEVTFPSLGNLKLTNIDDIEIVWDNQFVANSFCKLQMLRVEACANLKSIFPSRMLEIIFQCLKSLHIVDCCSLREVFDTEVPSFQETCVVTTTQLKNLNLTNLPKLKHIWNKDPGGIFSFQNLQEVIVVGCEKIKSVFPASISKNLRKLEYLEIEECGAEVIFEKEEGGEVATTLEFPKLTSLLLSSLSKLKCLFPGPRPLKWPSLETLSVWECKEIEIFASKCSSFQETFQQEQLKDSVQQSIFVVEEVVFPKLEELELSSRALEEMASSSCKLRNIQASSRFQNLSYLTVKGTCNRRYLFSLSPATSMVQLKFLEVSHCKDMEEILLTENVEGGKIISPKELFPRLEKLRLEDLPILKRFCIGNNIQFLSLKKLIIEHCPKLITFIFNPDSSGTTAGEKVNANERAHNIVQPLFSEEVTFPSLENLGISHIDDIEIVWDNQFAANSCCKLQILRVEACANLKSIFPSRMLEVIFQCLETLHIVDCCSLREVFDIEVPSFQETRAITTTQLKNLYLTYLPKLKHIWNKDPEGIFSFQNLQQVIVVGCQRIKSVFPTSISENLTQLEFLKIENCGVEVIIEKEDEGREVAATFEFPKLTSLELLSLPKLKCFFPGARSSKWPLLEMLCVLDCKGIEIFASKYLRFQETFQLRQPLFVVEEGAFPNLKDLGLELNGTVWPSQLLEELFCKLEFLVVGSRDNGSAFSPSTFIGRLHNLKKLFVSSRYWEEMFPYESLVGQEKCATTLTNLRQVVLFKMCMLKHMWKEDTQPCPIFHNLETLTVSNCGKLRNLVPSSVSFQNLTNLEISECHGLSELVTSSTAKSLVQLQNMSVTECKGITQIVAREESEADEVITFSKLTHLKLDWLPKLSNFCSGSYSFMFPSLEEVIVRQCPEMKVFCAGVLSTPKLERVQALNEDEWHWKDDLNTTIYWLWEGGSSSMHWLWEIGL